MTYTPTIWVDRNVQFPNRFTLTDNGDGTYTLTPQPGTVTAAGTPISAANLNKIEQGIADALPKTAGASDPLTGPLIIEVNSNRALQLKRSSTSAWQTIEFFTGLARRFNFGRPTLTDDFIFNAVTGEAGSEVETEMLRIKNDGTAVQVKGNDIITTAGEQTINGALTLANNKSIRFENTLGTAIVALVMGGDNKVYVGSSVNDLELRGINTTLNGNDIITSAGGQTIRSASTPLLILERTASDINVNLGFKSTGWTKYLGMANGNLKWGSNIDQTFNDAIFHEGFRDSGAKIITLYSGWYTDTVSSGSYVDIFVDFLWESELAANRSVYFEGVFSNNNGANSDLRLYDKTAGTTVVTLSNSTADPDRVRSASAITLIDGHEYTIQFYTGSSNNGELTAARLIII